MTDERHAIGGNAPPLADQIELAYSTLTLAQEHQALADIVDATVAKAATIGAINTDDEQTAAAAVVIELRELVKRVDDTATSVKAPVLAACRSVDAFFNGLNNSDTKKAGPLSRHKRRIEDEISARGFRIAAENRRLAAEAAQRERERAEAEAKAAAEQEAAGRSAVSEVLMDQAVKSEGFAERFEATATGPIQDLARQHTPVATIGLRGEPGFEIVDRDALRASLGPLGRSFTADAVDAAIRRFRAMQETEVGKMAFRDDDQDSQKRVLVSNPPLLGVEFFIKYAGMVRA